MPSTAKKRGSQGGGGSKARGANAGAATSGQSGRGSSRASRSTGKSSKGSAQLASTTRAAVEAPNAVGRGNTDFSRTANKQISGHQASAARRAQGRGDTKNG